MEALKYKLRFAHKAKVLSVAACWRGGVLRLSGKTLVRAKISKSGSMRSQQKEKVLKCQTSEKNVQQATNEKFFLSLLRHLWCKVMLRFENGLTFIVPTDLVSLSVSI